MTIALGIVGCGDVAFRTYFPGLGPIVADGSAVVAVCFDPLEERAKRAAALFPGAVAVTSLDALLQHPGLNAAVNLTPAPLHCEVTTALLNAGLDVFSEKPLAGSVDDGQELIALAKQKGKLLFCAPAVMATNRMRWLKRVIEAGKIGQPTLAVAQMANMGPSGWRAVHRRSGRLLHRRRRPADRHRRLRPPRDHRPARPGQAGPGLRRDRDPEADGPDRAAARSRRSRSAPMTRC